MADSTAASPATAAFKLRPAVEADLPAIHAIYASYAPDSIVTFAYVAPSVGEMTAKFLDARDKFPWLVAVAPSSSTASSTAAAASTDAPGVDGAADGAGEAVVGYAYLGAFRPREGWRFTVEDSIYVHKDWKRRGIGRALLQALLREGAAYGYHSVIAAISSDPSTGEGSASITLHASLGFREMGRIREAGWKGGKWLDNVFMQCMLPSSALPEASAAAQGGAAALPSGGSAPPAREPGKP
jgi:L-amino acid N-acyltransferase YncA